MHRVVIAEGFVAIGTFSHAGLLSLFNAFSAENVPASFDRSVFEVTTADGAKSKRLQEQLAAASD